MWGIVLACACCLYFFAQVQKDSKDWFDHPTLYHMFLQARVKNKGFLRDYSRIFSCGSTRLINSLLLDPRNIRNRKSQLDTKLSSLICKAEFATSSINLQFILHLGSAKQGLGEVHRWVPWLPMPFEAIWCQGWCFWVNFTKASFGWETSTDFHKVKGQGPSPSSFVRHALERKTCLTGFFQCKCMSSVIKTCQGHHVGCDRRPSRKCLLQRMYNLMHCHVGWGFPKELPRDVR